MHPAVRDDSRALDPTRTRILDLRLAGHGIDSIAAQVGVTPRVVAAAVKELVAAANHDRDEMVAVAYGRLEREVRRIRERLDSLGGAFDRRDVETLLKVMERQSKLFGLDAPTKTESKTHVTFSDMSDDELYAEAARHGVVLAVRRTAGRVRLMARRLGLAPADYVILRFKDADGPDGVGYEVLAQ